MKLYLTRFALQKDHFPPLAHLLATLSWQEINLTCAEESQDATYLLDNSIFFPPLDNNDRVKMVMERTAEAQDKSVVEPRVFI